MTWRKIGLGIMIAFLLNLFIARVAGQTATPNADTPIVLDLTPPELGDFDETTVVDIDLATYPIIPEFSDQVRQIYTTGQELGNNLRVFSKVGDCMTASPDFLTPLGTGEYDLGEYTDLQPVIDYFAGVPARGEDFAFDSFTNPGLATTGGFNTASVLDSIWANPEWCETGESPLVCEYRVSRPAFSVIMFGTNDVFFTDPALFDYNLRIIVIETIEAGIIPILNTFPSRPEYPERSLLLNQIIVDVASDYDIPLINLWLALQNLLYQGVDQDETIHLTVPVNANACIFTEETLQFGYTVRNLITLQTLDMVLRGLELLESPTDAGDCGC